jgi:hypothetical protein
MQLKKETDTTAQGTLSKRIGREKGKLEFMKKTLEETLKAEAEANPEIAAAIAEAKEIAARQKEEASRLDTSERNELKDKMAKVFATGDDKLVQDLIG